MIRLAVLIAGILTCVLFWHECGEDIAVFCYRIGVGAFTALRSRAMVAVPVTVNPSLRARAACLKPSGISSMPCIARRDFES
jgi:hypothetical protein